MYMTKKLHCSTTFNLYKTPIEAEAPVYNI